MKQMTLFAFFYGLFAAATIAAEPWEGHYVWNNTGQEERYGNVHQSVILDIAVRDESTATVSCAINWKPGMEADFGAVVQRSAIADKTTPDGTTAKVIPFVFEDSNGNKGTGDVEVNGTSATLNVNVTDRQFPEAARQYGTYRLVKSP